MSKKYVRSDRLALALGPCLGIALCTKALPASEERGSLNIVLGSHRKVNFPADIFRFFCLFIDRGHSRGSF